MSVLKNLDINLLKREKETLRNFLLLYMFFIFVISSFGISFYYLAQKEIQHKKKLIALNDYANELMIRLKELKLDTTDSVLYPWSDKFQTMLYDKNYKLLYSTKDNPAIDLSELVMNRNMIARYLKHHKDYYLNAQYIIVEMLAEDSFDYDLFFNIVIYAFIFIFIMVVLGYFLLGIFLKPLKDAVYLLDRFIKDTTHELNTPVSTILTNIELLQLQNTLAPAQQKNINRIEIGAKTLANIYDDLIFLLLQNKLHTEDESIDLREILNERIEYFQTLLDMKNIVIKKSFIDDVVCVMDRKKCTKVIDNLLSNSIKYNKHHGSIEVTLKANMLTIYDTGIGLHEEEIKNLFIRYNRFTTSTGGFGIGLHIVKSILDSYGFSINVESKKDTFTSFSIVFVANQ